MGWNPAGSAGSRSPLALAFLIMEIGSPSQVILGTYFLIRARTVDSICGSLFVFQLVILKTPF